ncbi:MAG: hypothetical protein HZC46_09485 [Ignavibacterium album]|uniref:hypothetical protein n=1 Tax=Ignavibacterium album TaxID=591197 RepID=UPI0026F37595|nr:hypothetical protein [Ignavibacterium album]MBI5662365.1 hypothetical protein [Ignavibacterium album]HOP50124.1 hypothetical protein [Ignavibacteriales bacterium]
MKKLSKLIFPIIVAAVIIIIYFTYFAPSDKLGSFSKFNPGSEVNQQVNAAVVKEKGFERDANGNIISFFARDKDNIEMKVTSHEPIMPEIAHAAVVELLGHIHENSITASKVSIIK